MSTITETETAQPAAGQGLDCYPLYRMSIEKYEQLVASGVFTKRDKFQLVNGLLVAKMTKNPPHSIAKGRCVKALDRIVSPSGWHVRSEDPVRLPPCSEPEPDVCVVRGKDSDYGKQHPGADDVGLLVEIADTSVTLDRAMATTWAAHGIPVYWIVNLVDHQVETYAQPTASGYGVKQIYPRGQFVPVVLDGTTVGRLAVDDILP
jgi:Uma2 family endonuclease